MGIPIIDKRETRDKIKQAVKEKAKKKVTIGFYSGFRIFASRVKKCD